MQRRSTPLKWQASTACDALDGSTAPTGGMALLTNLIPDPTTEGYWQARPAATLIKNLALTFTPGRISVGKVVGDILYGMISGTTAGVLDYPFALNLATATLIPVTGTQNNTTLPTPLSLPANNMPQMDMIGTKLVVTHPNFDAVHSWFGWFDLTIPTSPVWHAGQLTGGFITFTVPPIAVKQFFNRAYYIHNLTAGPAVIFSDILNATNCTNANQILTFDDLNPLTALGQLPMSNLLGALLQSLIVFKGAQAMYQISGDAALNTLLVNRLSFATGTQAPNSIVPTPIGLAFAAPDGVRMIDFSSKVSDPIGNQGSGIAVPFQIQNANPNFINGAYSGNVLRYSISDAAQYWYHFDKQRWSGPHTFPSTLIWQWSTFGHGDTFVMQPSFNLATGVYLSDYLQSGTSTFVEPGSGGLPFICTWKTVLLPDTDQINNVCVTESTLDAKLPSGVSALALVPTINLYDQDGTSLDQVVLAPGKTANVQPYQLQWTKPLVFARAQVQFAMSAIFGFSIGTLRLRYQMTQTYQTTVVSSGQPLQVYTFDPAQTGAHAVLSGGNLVLTGDGTNNDTVSLSTVGTSSGRYYAEFTLAIVDTPGFAGVGVTTLLGNVNVFLGSDNQSWCYYSDGNIFYNGASIQLTTSFNTAGTIISVALDATDGLVWFAINGAWVSGDPVTSVDPLVVVTTPPPIYLGVDVFRNPRWVANFGQNTFTYTPPQGFQAWNTIGE